MAIPNLYQSFWETLSEKDWNKHFWPFLIYTSLSGKNCWKKFGRSIFGHSKFIPVFLGKIVGKKIGHFWPYQNTSPFGELEHPFLAIPNLYQSFWEKLSEKDWNKHFSIPDLYQFFWEKLSEKNWNNHFWPFLIYTSLLEKNCWKKIQNGHYWPFQIYTSLSGKHCQKKIGTNIFGHS